MLIPLLGGIGIFITILLTLALLILKFERDRLETEVYWQLVDFLMDYPNIVWEDIEFLLGTEMPNEEMRKFVREEFAKEETAEDIGRELMKKWFDFKRLSYTYDWLIWRERRGNGFYEKIHKNV